MFFSTRCFFSSRFDSPLVDSLLVSAPLVRVASALCVTAALGSFGCSEDAGTDDPTDGDTTTGMGGTASDGTADGSTDGGEGINQPQELTLESFQTFFANETYGDSPWAGEEDPRNDSHGGVNVHGWVRVFYNETAMESIQAGNGDLFGEEPHLVGSMIVKEIYSEAMTETQIGIAAMLKIAEGTGPTTWMYYCAASDGTCTGEGSEEIPVFGEGESACHSCHGGEIFSVDFAQVEGLP